MLACLVRVDNISDPRMSNVNEADYTDNSKLQFSKEGYIRYNGHIGRCSR